ncbi:MAG: hypothetical protein ACTSUR_00620, partial [Candidatus Heimdallarchaeaceae archaeon]
PKSDSSYFYPTKLYNITVLDIADFVPFFSGIAEDSPFVILNSAFEGNLTKIDIRTYFQLLWFEDKNSKQSFLQQIDLLNREQNLKIEVLEKFDYEIITDQYWIPSVLHSYLLALFSALIFCLVLFLSSYNLQAVNKQIKNFRVFFARGFSIKKALTLAVFPLILYTSFYILIGYTLGLVLALIIGTILQPQYYLKLKLFVFPSSLPFFLSELVILILLIFFSSLFIYRKLKIHIPTLDFNQLPISFEEEDNN